MADNQMSEQERRELAEAHKDDIDVDAAMPVAPRRLGQMISLRLEPEIAAALRELAVRRGASVSDLLREGATRVLAAAEQGIQVLDFRFGVEAGTIRQSSWAGSPTSSALPCPTFDQVTAA